MKKITTGLIIALLSATAHPTLAKRKPAVPEPKREPAAVVLPIAPGSFIALAGKPTGYKVADKFILPKINETDTASFNRLNAVCDLGFNTRAAGGGESALIALFGALIKPLFGFMFHKADKAIDTKLEGYKAEWSAGMTVSLFQTDAGGTLMPKYRCIRISRVSEVSDQPNDVAKLDFDALFLVHWLPRNQSWQLVPLRVFTDDPVARGDKVKFAMSLAGSAISVDEGRGDTQTLPEAVILKGGYKIATDSDPTNGTESTTYPVAVCDLIKNNLVVPASFLNSQIDPCKIEDQPPKSPSLVSNVTALAIPGTIPQGNAMDGSAANLVFKVAEVGEGRRKGRLEDWKTFIGKAGDGISDALTTAISGLLGSD
jgi:hypothetical protein